MNTGNMILLKADVVEKSTKEVGRLATYFTNHTSDLINFGIKVVLAIVIFLICGRIISWIRKLVKRSMNHANADTGVITFVDSALKAGLYLLLVISIAVKFGVEPTSVAALMASGGVAIGLALQGSLSNLAGGVLILVLKPFVVGDYIIEDTNKNEGTVKEIQIFYTKLTTIDNKTIVIPNGTLANTSLVNVTAKDERRLDLRVDISYEADLKKAKDVIEQIIREDKAILKDEELLVFVDELGQSSVVIGSRAWVKTEDYWTTRWRILETIKLRLDEEKIEIPYNQLRVHVSEVKAEEK